VSRFFTLCLAASIIFAGCANSVSSNASAPPSQGNAASTAASESAPAGEPAQSAASADNPWADFDTSEAVNIVFYALGSADPAFSKVVGLANERMKQLINTTVDIEIIPLSDFATKYPLVLAGGEDCDLIFSAPWLFFAEQADRGAFMELTEEFRNTWMPETMKSQVPVSWKQAEYKGKVIVTPRNASDYEQAYGVVVRKDMRDKYNIPEITDMDGFEQYLYAVAEGEKGTGAYAFNIQPSFPIDQFLFTSPNNWFSTGFLMWDADTPGNLKAEDCFFTYDKPEFLDYALRQAKWAQAGFWPSNAITNTIHVNDLFQEGTSLANACHYKSANTNIQEMAKKGIEVEYFNILSETTNTRISPYNYDAVAITSFSKYPERAALALDVMKNDPYINVLLQGGIEGEHYILEPDNTHSLGPNSADYSWSGWAWALRSAFMPDEGGLDPSCVTMRDLFDSKNLDPDRFPIDGYIFGTSGIEAEYALIQSIINEYRYSFDLGVFGDDTEAKYNQFMSELRQAGLDKVVDAAKLQLDDFLKS
jgi:ABC-type glycerol-3-phosphate transport system substrate-binding protein